MSYQKRTSPWVYIGVGCGVILVIGLIVLGVLGVLSYRFARDVTRGLTDPQVRHEKVTALLGTDDIPAGYHAAISLSIPMLVDLAVLSDKEPSPDGSVDGLDSRGFIFLKITDFGEQRRELLDFLEGRSEEFRLLQEAQIGVKQHEFLGRGRFDSGGNEVVYASYRADIAVEDTRLSGLATVLTVDCPNKSKIPIGIWFGPDSAADTDVQELDLTGTPADESALKDFIDQFELCGAAR